MRIYYVEIISNSISVQYNKSKPAYTASSLKGSQATLNTYLKIILKSCMFNMCQPELFDDSIIAVIQDMDGNRTQQQDLSCVPRTSTGIAPVTTIKL